MTQKKWGHGKRDLQIMLRVCFHRRLSDVALFHIQFRLTLQNYNCSQSLIAICQGSLNAVCVQDLFLLYNTGESDKNSDYFTQRQLLSIELVNYASAMLNSGVISTLSFLASSKRRLRMERYVSFALL